MTEAYIKAISYYLPEKVVTNEQLVEEFPEWSVEKVSKKVGISKRHVTAEDETATDMAVCASQKLFEEYSISPAEIDFILLCTQSPDYHLPTSACLVQNRLGIPTTCGALDFDLGCSGFVYGLSLAKGLIVAGMAKNVLFLTSETYNKYIHPSDKGNRSIFGDGAAATLVSTEGFAKIGQFVFGTDGRGAENLMVKTGGARFRKPLEDVVDEETGIVKHLNNLYMNGSEIFNFTLEAVPPLLEETIKKNGLDQASVDKYVLHQANKFMLDTIRKVCGIEKGKFYVNLENVGNTVSSTIPIALKQLMEMEGGMEGVHEVAIAGFGVGYSWGACVLTI